MKEEKGKLVFVNSAGTFRQPLDIAFGAGHGGITFCTINGPTEFTKLRISYFPREKRWRATPGMVKIDDKQPGDTVEGDAIVGCVKCHSVTLPAGSAVPETRFMGVGCESCHGPGSAHVAAARTPGARDLKIVDFGAKSALELQSICSKCHSPINDAMLTQGDAGLLRFQPESLLASRCFSDSDGKISCLSCHEPHKNLERAASVYETACLRCHAPASKPAPKPIMSAGVCKVNPSTGCIRCHMPKRLSFHEGDIPTMMTDHLIAVHAE